MRLQDESLRGRTVLTSDGIHLGQVESLTLETSGWRVESLEVKLRREAAQQIGAQRKFMQASVMPIPVSQVRSVQDAVILSVGVSELRESQR